VLKEMKKGMDVEEIGIQIENIRKTRAGKIRVTVKEKKDGAIQNFKDTTGRTLKDMATTYEVGRNRKTIVIRNIDPVTNSCEVRTAIAVALGISEDAVQMHTLKLNKENETHKM
jgi:hypothetical protein